MRNGFTKGENMDKKVTGIVSYFTSIGWLVAYFAGDKEGAKFHLNQSLVVNLGFIISGIISCIPLIGWIIYAVAGIFLVVCWILGLIAAINEEEKEIPLLGKIKILK